MSKIQQLKELLLQAQDVISEIQEETDCESYQIITDPKFITYSQNLVLDVRQNIKKVQITLVSSSHRILSARDLVIDSDPDNLYDALVDLFDTYLSAQTNLQYSGLNIFAEPLAVSGSNIELRFFVSVDGVENFQASDLPNMYIQLDYDFDPAFDKRIYIKPVDSKAYVLQAADSDPDEFADWLQDNLGVQGISMHGSKMNVEDISNIAEVLLSNCKAGGSYLDFRNTNIPPEYEQDFIDAGWEEVRF